MTNENPMPPQLSRPSILKSFKPHREHTQTDSRVSAKQRLSNIRVYTFSITFSKAENHILFSSSQPPMSESVEWVSSFVGDAPPGEVRLMPSPPPIKVY